MKKAKLLIAVMLIALSTATAAHPSRADGGAMAAATVLKFVSEAIQLFKSGANPADLASIQSREMLQGLHQRLGSIEAAMVILIEKVEGEQIDEIRKVVRDAGDEEARERLRAAIVTAARDIDIWADGTAPISQLRDQFMKLDEAIGLLLQRQNHLNVPLFGEALRMELAIVRAVSADSGDAAAIRIRHHLKRYQERLERAITDTHPKSLPHWITTVRGELTTKIDSLKRAAEEADIGRLTWMAFRDHKTYDFGRNFANGFSTSCHYADPILTVVYDRKRKPVDDVLEDMNKNETIKAVWLKEDFLHTLIHVEAYAQYLLATISWVLSGGEELNRPEYKEQELDSEFLQAALAVQQHLELKLDQRRLEVEFMYEGVSIGDIPCV